MEEVVVDIRHFTDRYRGAFAQTLEVSHAVPEDRWDWRPAEAMRSFRELVGDIVGNELVMIRGVLYDEWDLDRSRKDFSSRREAMDFFRNLHQDAVTELSRLTNEFFHRKVASPFVEPMSRAQLAIGMLEKESNERGSLYVYLRLVSASRTRRRAVTTCLSVESTLDAC